MFARRQERVPISVDRDIATAEVRLWRRAQRRAVWRKLELEDGACVECALVLY